jgi:hypothetical protein
VIVITMARARRIRPATRAGRSGDPGESVLGSDTGLAVGLVGRGVGAGAELGTGEGVMVGKS